MKLFQTLSGKVTLLIFTIFAVSFAPKISKVVTGEDTCLCAYDGYGYYLYLPHLFNEGNLDIKRDWTQQLQDDYCNGIYAYQIVRTEQGKELNTYHLGQAFVELPAYLAGDLFARIMGFKTDGFSKPYFVAFLLNVLLFIFIGLYYLRKLLLLYLNDIHTAISIFVIYAASNIYITFFLQYDLQHLFLFAMNAVFFYHLLQLLRTKSRKHLIYSAIILGLTVAIRPTQVLLGIFPTIFLLHQYGIKRAFFARIWIYPALGLLWNLPQIAYWWIIGGEPFVPNLHTENIILSDPNIIDFLFSYKKGWLLYCPVFLVGLHGFYVLYKDKRVVFWSILSFLLIYIWVMSSWECWWYAQSYSSRVMVDIYPILAILLGVSITSWKRPVVQIAGYTFLIFCCLLSILQTHQGFKGYLSYENMTKQHYWYIFGKIDIPNYTMDHQELNRGLVDPNWIEKAKRLPKSDYSYETTLVYELVEPVSVTNESLFLTDIVVLDKLPSDEGMFEIQISCKTQDSTKSAILMFETLTEYKWNWYNWSPVELSVGQAQNELVDQTHYINLQRMRHSIDKMNIYFNSPNDASIEVESLKIIAHTIVRD